MKSEPIAPQPHDFFEEMHRVIVIAALPNAKKQAIETGDLEWLEEIHRVERSIK